jgi:hypothetical protein
MQAVSVSGRTSAAAIRLFIVESADYPQSRANDKSVNALT